MLLPSVGCLMALQSCLASNLRRPCTFEHVASAHIAPLLNVFMPLSEPFPCVRALGTCAQGWRLVLQVEAVEEALGWPASVVRMCFPSRCASRRQC